MSLSKFFRSTAWLVVLVACGSDPQPGGDDDDDTDAGVGDDAPPPDNVVLSLAPSNHDFGVVATGSASATQTFTITNTGSAPSGAIELAFAGSDAPQFARMTTTCGESLAAGASCTVDATLAPSAAGTFAIALSASEAGGANATASLEGEGVVGTMSINPSVDNFGQVILGTVGDRTFTVRNTSAVPIATPVPLITGTTVYTLGNTDCTAALAADATCQFVVHFAPQAVGAQAASLSVTSGTGSATAQVAGTGAANLIVTRTGAGTISGPNINCGATCTTVVTSTPITLTAAPSAGASFSSWGGAGAGCGTAPTCAVAITSGTVTATAAFADIPTLRLTVHNPAGTGAAGLIQVDQLDETCGTTGGDETCRFDVGARTIRLTPINDCTTFSKWTGGGCTGVGPCTITLTADVDVRAEFKFAAAQCP
jgi:hypothetical protein